MAEDGSESRLYRAQGVQVSRLEDVIAVTTPIPDARGNVSAKTPIYHLPVYKVHLDLDSGDQVVFHCDLADLTDLLSKLKELSNQWRHIG